MALFKQELPFKFITSDHLWYQDLRFFVELTYLTVQEKINILYVEMINVIVKSQIDVIECNVLL